MSKVRHVLGISGGKDSAALAIYLRDKYPQLDMEYYFCDTGKELDETYKLIKNLEVYLGKKITPLEAADGSHKDPFDHYYEIFGGYLPSSRARWCTKVLKLEPFEKFVGDDPVISYVGIRGDENREGYVSKKSNIQSIFPFRQNIWSEDVIKQVLNNSSQSHLMEVCERLIDDGAIRSRVLELLSQPLSPRFDRHQKLSLLLDIDTVSFNKLVYDFLQQTEYPLALEKDFPLIDNDDILVKADIYRTLRESGVGVPEYYENVSFEVDGKQGQYARSRSGCFFCFFQQKIEWVWLYEQYPERFAKAMAYEKDGYSWMDGERLEDLIKPERIRQIKLDHIAKVEKYKKKDSSPYLLDLIGDEDDGCISCFV
ncbi:MAG: phosphoadenosine phosphosulfate reductase family protein [Bacteroidota bacterium]